MATEKTLDDLFLETLNDVYYAEKHLAKTLPKMARAAQDRALADGFLKHADETEIHVERLEQIFELMGKPARAKTCDAIIGIIEEGKSVMEDFKDTIALDAGLISSAQAVEHYEITRYGTLIAWARELGRPDCAMVLEETLEEEKAADLKLTGLADGEINAVAEMATAK